MRRLSPVLAVALLCSLLVACGGKDNSAANDYVNEVNKAQNDFAAKFESLAAQITPKSTPDQDQETLTGFRNAVDKAVKDLNAIEVPGEVTDLHKKLVGEVESYGTAIDDAKTAFKTGDASKITDAQADLKRTVTTVSGQINGTIDEINKKLHD